MVPMASAHTHHRDVNAGSGLQGLVTGFEEVVEPRIPSYTALAWLLVLYNIHNLNTEILRLLLPESSDITTNGFS